MDDYETTADLNEAIYYERLDVDREMAQLEAEGNRYWRNKQKVDRLLDEGSIEEAVNLCSHGHVGKLNGSCSETDARYMEEGYRCFECGCVVDEIHGNVLHIR